MQKSDGACNRAVLLVVGLEVEVSPLHMSQCWRCIWPLIRMLKRYTSSGYSCCKVLQGYLFTLFILSFRVPLYILKFTSTIVYAKNALSPIRERERATLHPDHPSINELAIKILWSTSVLWSIIVYEIIFTHNNIILLL